ncbi:putative hydroperoxide dehydratase [Helianthus annuus]|nr:putative hydroperoxide dehydratase [Helianthus annuus]
MATSSLAFPSLHHHRNLDTPIIFRHRRATGVHLIKATKDSIPPLSATSADTAATTTTTTSTTAAATNLPLRPIPGSYGIPFYQPLKDRFEYFYGPGGRDEYFKSRVHKFQSTVFRANMPPGPFISNNPNVVVLLDAKSFPTLFDVSKVEKKDLFTGTYMPSTELTGGHRVLSYLDPSEPKHGPLKNMVFFMLKSSILFPNTLKWIGRAGTNLHTQLAAEIRGAIKNHGGKVTMAAMEQMPLMKSVVYESLRIEPPVALQYGKARRDMMIESHDAVFKVKEGEMLFGYQPFATKDPKVFDRPEEFVPDRFVGAGEELLKYVTWSNGPETEGPTVGNKQCAGKDFVVLITRLFVVELFRRYDSFDIEVAASPLGAKVTLTSLKRARM